MEMVYFDPTEKDKYSRDLIERLLKHGQSIEILKSRRFSQQTVELIANKHSSINSQPNGRVTHANREYIHHVVNVRKVFAFI